MLLAVAIAEGRQEVRALGVGVCSVGWGGGGGCRGVSGGGGGAVGLGC